MTSQTELVLHYSWHCVLPAEEIETLLDCYGFCSLIRAEEQCLSLQTANRKLEDASLQIDAGEVWHAADCTIRFTKPILLTVGESWSQGEQGLDARPVAC